VAWLAGRTVSQAVLIESDRADRGSVIGLGTNAFRERSGIHGFADAATQLLKLVKGYLDGSLTHEMAEMSIAVVPEQLAATSAGAELTLSEDGVGNLDFIGTLKVASGPTTPIDCRGLPGRLGLSSFAGIGARTGPVEHRGGFALQVRQNKVD